MKFQEFQATEMKKYFFHLLCFAILPNNNDFVPLQHGIGTIIHTEQAIRSDF